MTAESAFVTEYLNAVRPELFPIYVLLACLTAWLGLVTLQTMFEPTEGARAVQFTRLVRYFMLATVAIPFVQPAAIAATRCWLKSAHTDC